MTLFSSLKSKASKSDSDSDSDPPPRYSQVVDDDRALGDRDVAVEIGGGGAQREAALGPRLLAEPGRRRLDAHKPGAHGDPTDEWQA